MADVGKDVTDALTPREQQIAERLWMGYYDTDGAELADVSYLLSRLQVERRARAALEQAVENLHCYQDGGQYFIDGFEDCRKQVRALLRGAGDQR
jgi:hypothetical protein